MKKVGFKSTITFSLTEIVFVFNQKSRNKHKGNEDRRQSVSEITASSVPTTPSGSSKTSALGMETSSSGGGDQSNESSSSQPHSDDEQAQHSQCAHHKHSSTLKSSWSIFARIQNHCLKRQKRKHRARDKRRKMAKKLNIFDHGHMMQSNSCGQENNALKWDKLSPNEFETLQEYIQCK